MKSYFLRCATLLLGAFLFSGCITPRGVYKAGYDFSAIKTIRVDTLTSVADQPNSGAVAADEFMRQMIGRGYSVKMGSGDADVILTGNVTEYQPNRRYLVQSNENRGSRRTVVVQQPVELSGTGTYNLGTVFGLDQSNKIVVSNATVGVSAYLKDARTGEILWSSNYTYEGLDLDTALEGTVRYLLNSWPVKKQ